MATIARYELTKDYSKSYIPAGFSGLAGMAIGGGMLVYSFFIAAPVAALALLIAGSILLGLSTITAGSALLSKVLQDKRKPEYYSELRDEIIGEYIYNGIFSDTLLKELKDGTINFYGNYATVETLEMVQTTWMCKAQTKKLVANPLQELVH